jgi:hypothetical protein
MVVKFNPSIHATTVDTTLVEVLPLERCIADISP